MLLVILTIPAPGIIVPMCKRGDKEYTHCCCPISLVDSIVKVADRVVMNRIQIWVQEKGIFHRDPVQL